MKRADLNTLTTLHFVAAFIVITVCCNLACVPEETSDSGREASEAVDARHVDSGEDRYFPPSEAEGGWRKGDPGSLGVDRAQLQEAIDYHDTSEFTQSHGGSLVIIYQGHIIGETYVTGTEDGPQPWTRLSAIEVHSSTKSVFGTAVGVFLDEYRDRVDLETYLVGQTREESLIPQIWEQPITDERKMQIKVKNVLSMTSGHEGPEPWSADPSARRHYPGYEGPFQMYEYCFGWWFFDGIAAQHTLKFEPGQCFNYSNFGLELMALAMRNLSGEDLGPYVFDRVLTHIGMPKGLKENRPREIVSENYSDQPAWSVGGGEGCNAYGADRSESPLGINSIAGSCFRSTARDFARLGYLWLNYGRWGDRQLVPEEWMRTATSRFVRDDGETPSNYGYTFWVLDEWDKVPKDTFASRGYCINDCYVIPSLDLVVVRQGNSNPPRDVRSVFTETLMTEIVAAIPSAP